MNSNSTSDTPSDTEHQVVFVDMSPGLSKSVRLRLAKQEQALAITRGDFERAEALLSQIKSIEKGT